MASAQNVQLGAIRTHLIAGAGAVGFLVLGVGGWAATTELAGAVVAAGVVVVNSNVKKIQHPIGGIVKELLVRDGDFVKAGQVIVRLDDTQARANLAMHNKRNDELLGRQAREEAERDGAERIVFPEELTKRSADPDVARTHGGPGETVQYSAAGARGPEGAAGGTHRATSARAHRPDCARGRQGERDRMDSQGAGGHHGSLAEKSRAVYAGRFPATRPRKG